MRPRHAMMCRQVPSCVKVWTEILWILPISMIPISLLATEETTKSKDEQ